MRTHIVTRFPRLECHRTGACKRRACTAPTTHIAKEKRGRHCMLWRAHTTAIVPPCRARRPLAMMPHGGERFAFPALFAAIVPLSVCRGAPACIEAKDTPPVVVMKSAVLKFTESLDLQCLSPIRNEISISAAQRF